MYAWVSGITAEEMNEPVLCPTPPEEIPNPAAKRQDAPAAAAVSGIGISIFFLEYFDLDDMDNNHLLITAALN